MKKYLLLFICLLCSLNVSAQYKLERGRQNYQYRLYDRALPDLQAAAKEGYGEACYLLGEMYRWGNGTEQNYPIAMRMYQRGIEYGYDQGEAEMGVMYENGNGVTKNLQKAFELYQKSYNRGNLYGYYLLARCYYYGYGTEENNILAFKFFNDLYANRQFQEDYKWAYQYTCGYIGSCHEHGYGTKIDLEQAVIYYWRSDIADYVYHAALLAEEHKLTIFPNPNGTFKLDPAELFGSAVLKGLDRADAYYKYIKYAENRRGHVDYSTNFNRLLRAAEMGYGPAQKMLGDWYREGKGTPVNLLKAREWYAKAKANGEEVPEL